MVTRHRMLFAGLVLAALAAQGCGGPDIQAICEAQESCYGGNDKDVEACVIAFEAQADAADAIGCSDEFDESYTCFEEQASCHTEPTGAPCTTNDECGGGDGVACVSGQCQIKYYGFDPQSETNPCEAEQNAYQSCD